MQQSNFHSHCTFCDGHSIPENYIKFAIDENFRAYGFSSHSPLPFETSWNMSKDVVPEYIAEIGSLKKKYREQIEIYLGMEIDYLDETYNASIPYFQLLPLDYRIGSLHFLSCSKPLAEDSMLAIDGDYKVFEQNVNTLYDGNIQRVVNDFFETSMRMVETGGFDVVGHADKIVMNGQLYPGFDRTADWYQKPQAEYLHLIAEKGLIVEINTKNFMRKQQIYPNPDLLKELCELRIPVMVNSDCHTPFLMREGWREAVTLLRMTGFRSLRELVGGLWQDVAIV